MTPEVAISAQTQGRASSNTKPPDRPIRILHVIEGLGTGGAEQQLVAFILRSKPTRFRHEVCTLSTDGRHAAELNAAGVPVYSLGVTSEGSFVRSGRLLYHLMRQINPDIIHATLYRPGVVSRVVGKLCKKPVVTTLVGNTYDPEYRLDNPPLAPHKIWLARKLDELTTRWGMTWFVAISESVRESATYHLGLDPNKISVIRRGLVFEESPDSQVRDTADVRNALGWLDRYPLILNVGRLVPQKGQQYAIRAMPYILTEFPNVHLAIVGEGSLRPKLERLIRSLKLERHVSLLGERDDVPALLQAADMFVFPSLSEGLGNALVEAFGAGKPCVVSKIASLRELTDHGRVALLADPQSPKDLANNVLKFARDHELSQRIGLSAGEWVRSHYDIRQSVAALEALYESLVISV